MTTLLELKQIFKNLFDKIDANFSVLATRISSNISGLKLLIEGPSSSDNNSAYYNKLNLKDKNNNVISTLLLKNLFANGHTAGIVAPDDDTTVVNNGYLSVNPNKYYNKTEVDTLVTNAVTSGQVDLSNYYTSNEVDALLSNKQAAGNYATSGSLSDFKTSTVLGHIADYSDITNPMITSNGSNITLKNGCKFGAYTLGQDVTLNVTTTNQTVNTSAGSVGTVYTNTAFAGTTGLYLIMYDISNQGQTVRVGFRHIDGFNSDSAAYSTMGYMGEFYWDGTSISNPTYYPNNDMEYKPRKLLYNVANTNANFKKFYDDLQDKVNTTDLSTVATTGNYDDLTNKPTIPTVPTTLSSFTDDLGSSPTHTHSQYLTSHQDISGKANTADLATVATSGSYNDLSNKPTIPDAQVQANWNETNSSSKAYIKNKPTIPTVPTTLSSFTDDLGSSPTHTHSQYLTSHQDISGKANTSLSNLNSTGNNLVNTALDTNDNTTRLKFWTGTKAQYDAITTKDSNTLYNITDDTDISLTLLQTIYPVGSVYLSTNSTCPLASLFGTWTLVSSGKALWTGTGSNGGSTIEAGLPNITGTYDKTSGNRFLLNATTSEVTRTGAFYTSSSQSDQYSSTTGSGTVVRGLGFDASRSNSIYGNSNTVQPPAYVVNVWRRTA